MELKDKTDEELIKLVISLHDSIHISQCFNTRDLMMYSQAVNILTQRGFLVERKVQSRLSIARPSDEESAYNN